MKRKAWWVAGAVVLVGVLALGFWGVQRARAFEALARAGKAEAVAGLHSLQSTQLPVALTSFQRAQDKFGAARDLLGPEWLRGVPWVGRQLSAADTLASIGAEGSSAGVAATQLLIGAADAPAGDDRVTQLLRLSRPHLDAALLSLTTVAKLSDNLSPDGLVPQLADAVTEVQGQLTPLQLVLDRSQSMLDLERYLFSAQHRFLVLSQNSAELRPTGGFIGTYGLVEFGPDGFELTKFTDIYQLPNDTLDLPLPIRGVTFTHFAFRDSNWWIDFPTSAVVMNQFWQNLKQPTIDGIIALDIPTIRDLLKIYGPITVPESKVPLTADNVLEQLTYVVEFENGGPGTNRTLKKKKAVLSFAATLLREITHLSNKQFLPTVNSLAKSASEKHVQLAFNNEVAQRAGIVLGWSGALDPPPDTTDLIAVTNAVIKASKANIGVTKSLDYSVALQADGSADTTAKLGYRKSSLQLLGVPRQWMGNDVRVNRLTGTKAAAAGSTPFEAIDDATGLPTFWHYFRLYPSSRADLVLHSVVPDAARPTDASHRHYRLLMAKQADLVDTSARITVTVPAGWKVSGATASFRSSGVAVAAVVTSGAVTVDTPLRQDLLLDVSLEKA